ncbi:saccharopine dehydrogenase NADP-binding domain-containing protein [Anaeromicropila populeti]|uniref:Saccharopine dehydrogenase, NADP-dependent n=1 Tax=Anaeromicropila populeti TaxID=37658 RepID=A0A1I6JXF6_9FIRM|nr:saccharopine dehydrogenase NADP-binding domain-containing protein [Anaeromicropila populeti]SFR83652.1 Saccharopine dehydrogenase, NADP-dependent [Anaeromicropila populeti]
MSSPVVGVVGCGGAVGRLVCEKLSKSYFVRGGQRRKLDAVGKHISYVQVDLYDKESLKAFCKGCTVIVNCAGPTYMIGGLVAAVAQKAGAGYVDAFGADFLEAQLKQMEIDDKGKFIISAGSLPGLSGLLPIWLSKQGFDAVESMRAYSGGREAGSKNGCADIILSSIGGFGIPDAYWNQGQIVREKMDRNEKEFIPGFPETVYKQRYFTQEITRVAHRLGLKEAQWFNVMTDKWINELILKACASQMVDYSEYNLEKSVQEINEAAEKAIKGKATWYSIMIEMYGTVNGRQIGKRVVVRSKDSIGISAMVAVCAAEALVKNALENGTLWAFEMLNPVEVVKRLQEEKVITSLELMDIPFDAESMEEAAEEGVL